MAAASQLNAADSPHQEQVGSDHSLQAWGARPEVWLRPALPFYNIARPWWAGCQQCLLVPAQQHNLLRVLHGLPATPRSPLAQSAHARPGSSLTTGMLASRCWVSVLFKSPCCAACTHCIRVLQLAADDEYPAQNPSDCLQGINGLSYLQERLSTHLYQGILSHTEVFGKPRCLMLP